jgi:hypothetical protein
VSRGADTDDASGREIVPGTPVATAVTRISAPMWDVWRVIVAFDRYAQWHPVLSRTWWTRRGSLPPGGR